MLGAGIMGCSTALLLARQGFQVTLFEQASQPFEGASGWNGGRVHLGYAYSADASLRTARQLINGGMLFRDVMTDLLGGSIAGATSPQSDVFLLHRDSVVPAPAVEAYFRRVSDMVRGHPDVGRYLDDGARRGATRLAPGELGRVAGNAEAITDGWTIPERAVSTRWVARRIMAALASEPRIEQRMGTPVLAVRPDAAGGLDGPFHIIVPGGQDGPYNLVINATWQGRCALDQGLGLGPPAELSHRFRYALFIHTAQPMAHAGALIGNGPFGEVKAYGDRDFSLTWYPASLAVEGVGVAPPPVPMLDAGARQTTVARIIEGVASHIPGVRDLAGAAERVELRGGWTVAQHGGSIADPMASLHRRDRFGIRRTGRYISVDTGTFSTAPALAREIAEMFRSG